MRHFDADRVVIIQPDPGTIEFIAPLEGGRSKRRSLSHEDGGFSCDNGMVVISTPKDAGTAVGAPVIAVTWTWHEMRLARTIDGSLAVELVGKGFAMVDLVVPMGFAESSWFRFPTAPEAPVKQPSP